MTVSEIFNAISNHQIEGIMLHGQMADYFDFLSLHGFKRMQEYHYLDESTCMRSVHRYYIRRGLRLFLRAGEIIRDKKLTPAQNGAPSGMHLLSGGIGK